MVVDIAELRWGPTHWIERKKTMGTYAYRYCMCFTCKFWSLDAQPPPDVRAAHHSLSSAAGGGADDGLHQFLSQVRGESPGDIHRILIALKASVSEKHDFGGQICLPVWELKQGILAVPDRKGNRYKSPRLLMGFQFV
jgi:hypothetical protein